MFWFKHEHVAWLSPQIPQMRLVMKWASRGSMPFMKMSKPRNTIEVLYALSTCRLVKSISVWMPRLPTIRVIGSQDISLTITFCCVEVSIAMCSSPDSAFSRDEVQIDSWSRDVRPHQVLV